MATGDFDDKEKEDIYAPLAHSEISPSDPEVMVEQRRMNMRRCFVSHYPRTLCLLGLVGLFALVALAYQPVQAQTDSICDTVTELSLAECSALVALYDSTNGASWTHNDGWLVTNTPCHWYGISCEGLFEVKLAANNLVGSLPPEVGNLRPLKFDLSDNQLSGPIPAELGNLQGNSTVGMAQVDLSNNQLSGPIPPQIGNMSLVSSLDLSDNQLSGAIPAELSGLEGQGLIPYIQLDLSSNQLSGAIPAELGQMGRGTLGIHWDFSHNQLTGTLPLGLVAADEIGSLKTLDVSHNPLSGPLPADFVNSPLSALDFTDTSICEPEDAAFQRWLFGLPTLHSSGQTCICDSADLAGVSPAECDGLVALFNATDGEHWTQKTHWLATVAPCNWHGVTCENGVVRALDLSDNGLVSRLPTALGNLIHLTQLRLQNNLLTNVLPQSLTNLTQLTTFHFENTLLCEPAESTVQAWLAGIADLQRTSIACNLIHFPIIVR
jgi:hypothetical protein